MIGGGIGPDDFNIGNGDGWIGFGRSGGGDGDIELELLSGCSRFEVEVWGVIGRGPGTKFFDAGDGGDGFVDVVEIGVSPELIDGDAVEEERDGFAEGGDIASAFRFEGIAGGVHGITEGSGELYVFEEAFETPEAGVMNVEAEAFRGRERHAPLDFGDGEFVEPSQNYQALSAIECRKEGIGSEFPVTDRSWNKLAGEVQMAERRLYGRRKCCRALR